MKNGTRPSRVQLADGIDEMLRKAAWRLTGKKPNGQLDGATFHWPNDVKVQFGRLERAYVMLRRYDCGCDKTERKNHHCGETAEMAAIVLSGLGISKRHARETAASFAQLAHAPGPDETGEDGAD